MLSPGNNSRNYAARASNWWPAARTKLPRAEGHLTSASGPLRHFAATQQFGRFRSESDIQRAALTARIYEYAT